MDIAKNMADALRVLSQLAYTQNGNRHADVNQMLDNAREALAAYDESQHLELPTDYRVRWEIDAFNATTPREAAEEAWQRMRRVDSTANVFTVYGRDGSITDVDLSEDEE